MTVRFGNYRIGFFVAATVLAATVLSLAAHFASIYLPKIHHDFTIFAIVAPSVTLLLFLISLQWAQPRTEAVMLFILGVLWLTMGAWSTDIIGPVQCDGLAGQRTATKNGDTSRQTFCYEMKVIQAFSWALFIIMIMASIILFQLVSLAQKFGRFDIWSEPIRELPWFGEAPGFYNTHPGNIHPEGMMPYQGGYPYPQPMSAGSMAPTMHPGSTTIIQPGMNGQPATVTRI